MRQLAAPLIKIVIFAVITVMLTALLGLTIANSYSGEMSTHTARFTSVTGLKTGNDVRMSGVRIGQVTSLDKVQGRYADVGFEIDDSRQLPGNVTAQIKFRNLIGQRYVALSTGSGEANGQFVQGDRIPLSRTQPALNLTALFGGFQPLFRALDPEQVNQLSKQLIQVLQGEGGTVNGLLHHIGSLTSTLASKDEVIGKVIDNLNSVLETMNERRGQVAGLIDQVQQLSTGLAEQREPIGDAIASIGELTDTTAGLLESARPPIKDDIRALGELSQSLSQHGDLVEKFVSGLSHKTRKLTRLVSHGGWFNYYACSLTGWVGVKDLGIKVELPLTPLPGTSRPDRCGP